MVRPRPEDGRDADADALRRLGFGGRSGAGRRAALIVVDFTYGFTDPSSPLACHCDRALVATARLLSAARGAGAPVIFTTVHYDPAGARRAAAFVAKAPALALLTPNSRWAQVDARVAPAADEPVLPKLFASAFFDTDLAARLSASGCDTTVIVGASTSGCVRASAVDALQHGYRVLVVRDAVADRVAAAHAASLIDIDAKYGDVVSSEEAGRVLAAHLGSPGSAKHQ